MTRGPLTQTAGSEATDLGVSSGQHHPRTYDQKLIVVLIRLRGDPLTVGSYDPFGTVGSGQEETR
jgi:hypothetical protein